MKKLSLFLVVILCIILYTFQLFPPISFSSAFFDIEQYHSANDKDLDGIDDQVDILKNAKAYIKTRPTYKSKYYDGGYSNDEYGVCSDVVAIAMLYAGYDLQSLVDTHIQENTDLYNIDVIDRNIDFRRVRNLKVYFDNTAISLTCDINKIEEWQGGDIVIFEGKDGHIGIVSDRRNIHGVPLIIHHAHPLQLYYEEDILEERDDIIGHYRVNIYERSE